MDESYDDNIEYEYDEPDPQAPVYIALPPVEETADNIFNISEFLCTAAKEGEHLNKIAFSKLNEIYDEIGNDDNAVSTIIGFLQRRHGWNIEILAERADVDRILFEEYNIFDETMWEKVNNSQEILDLHKEVYRASEEYLRVAIANILKRDYKIN